MRDYLALKQPKTEKKPVRGLQYNVHTWGDPQATPVFLLHGWMDTGLSFQFLADAMSDGWYLIAPDWRGFGDTQWSPQGYWFPDYLADLDVLLDQYAADHAVRLVGHSMGGNIACLYAGSCPERVSHLVSLDAYGLPASDPADAPARYRNWLRQLKHPPGFLPDHNLDKLVLTIEKLAPGIGQEKARFVAAAWSRQTRQGKFIIKADPAHKCVNPVLYRREEARSCWRNINARVLFVFGEESRACKSYYRDGYAADCQACFSNLAEITLSGAGHMLHLQQAGSLAEVLETFLHE